VMKTKVRAPKPVDLTNTGSCAICGRRQKLTPGQTMVHYGFQISYGNGNYFGFQSLPAFYRQEA
jgi:hypothetical protein